jgi:hypothetical protein
MMSDLSENERALLERLVAALERITEAYETSVINQSRMVEKTLRTLDLASEAGYDDLD